MGLFGQNRIQKLIEDNRKYLEEFVSAEEKRENDTAGKLNSLGDTVKSLGENVGSLEQAVDELRRQTGRHDMAIEELLEAWEDKDAERREARTAIWEQKEKEERLVGLLESYQEQFWRLRKLLSSAEAAWSEQMTALDEMLRSQKLLCQFDGIEEEDAAVDFRLHDVVEVIDTPDPERDGKIARMYGPGCIYGGRVRKKARVAAWRYRKGERKDE